MIVLLSSVTWIILSQLQTQIIANFLRLDFYSINLTLLLLQNRLTNWFTCPRDYGGVYENEAKTKAYHTLHVVV